MKLIRKHSSAIKQKNINNKLRVNVENALFGANAGAGLTYVLIQLRTASFKKKEKRKKKKKSRRNKLTGRRKTYRRETVGYLSLFLWTSFSAKGTRQVRSRRPLNSRAGLHT